MTATAIKVALCMPTECTPFAQAAAAALLPIPANFFLQPVYLRGRHEAETCEKDEAWKQLLPYFVAIDPDDNLYVYTRGEGGAEARLHGDISVGLGGHVDEMPLSGETLMKLLNRECNREGEEEVNLPQGYDFVFVGLICDPTNDVGRVHIGLLAIRRVTHAEKAAMLAEAGVVEKGEFTTLAHLMKDDVFARLENWSKVAVRYVAQQREAIAA
jgi:predicted NUDIX family phosphoesterase